jgi:serine/threonine protein kinase
LQLGFGAFAVVFIGTHRPTGAVYAVKQVDRSKMFWGDRDALKDEIENLKKVRAGPNIVQLYEVFEEKSSCYLVTELMPGGELFDRIIEKKTFSEKEARNAIRCVLEALEYMHDRRVAHRDLKPENLLLKDPNGLLPVKLADFGFAKNVEKKNGCRTLCGTPGYLAPEILERFPAYDVKCDIWSVGVILFLLLGGYLPFDDEDENKVFDRTRNGEYDFRPQFWRNISSGAKDLVTKCLTINPNKRNTATMCLEHGWMTEKDSDLEGRSLNVEKLKNAMDGKRKMKAAINTVCINSLFEKNIPSASFIFSQSVSLLTVVYPSFSYLFLFSLWLQIVLSSSTTTFHIISTNAVKNRWCRISPT